MNIVRSATMVGLACIAFNELNAQTDVRSAADWLVVAAHESVKFGDVVSAGKLLPGLGQADVSYELTPKDGIRLKVLTRVPKQYAERIAELKKASEIEIEFGLPPLSRNPFSLEKLEKFRAKNGVIVFLYADWCPTCKVFEHKELQTQSLLKFVYESNVPILWADYTNSFGGVGPVGKFAKKMNLKSSFAFVVYAPDESEPIVLTDYLSAVEFEEALKVHLDSTKHHKK